FRPQSPAGAAGRRLAPRRDVLRRRGRGGVVMAAMTAAQRRRYELLYESCLCRPKRKAEVNRLVRRISTNRKRYEKVGKAVGVPWYVVGIIHSLEASGDFTRHLHNGDPLKARTVHVPAGRPKTGTH